jgi:predicted nucleic acid-binding protein
VTDTGVYLDSSALVKLVFEEDESHELRRFLRDFPLRFCSVVGRVEVLRVARSVDDDAVLSTARQVLAGTHMLDLSAALVSRAAHVDPPVLRALDAIHLASALSLEPDLAGMVVYDKRLAAAARQAGLTVWAPA